MKNQYVYLSLIRSATVGQLKSKFKCWQLFAVLWSWFHELTESSLTTKIKAYRQMQTHTVHSRFKKARFKKESRFKKDCWCNRFFSTEVVWFKKDFLRPNARFKKDFFPKSGKNRDFLVILEQFLRFFQKIFKTFHNSMYIS